MRDVLLRLAVSLVLGVLSFLYLSNRFPVNDSVPLRGDAWEYQSLAVNIAYGHGYVLGAWERPEVYKIKADELTTRGVQQAFLNRQHPYAKSQFFRAPGYVFFLASIYRTLGVRPEAVKVIQIGMLSLMAAALPWLGFGLWGAGGFAAGVLGAGVYILRFAPDPSQIMTEPLIAFSLFVWFLAFLAWEKKQTEVLMFVVGLLTGWLLLLKGLVFVFLAMMLVIRFVFNGKMTTEFMGGALLVITPWITYASFKAGQFIPICTEWYWAIYGANNEAALNSGANMSLRRLDFASAWEAFRASVPFWFRDAGTFWQHTLNKLGRGFDMDITVVCCLMLIAYLGLLIRRVKTAASSWLPLLLFVNLLLITVILFGDRRFVVPYAYFFLIPVCALPAVFTRKAQSS